MAKGPTPTKVTEQPRSAYGAPVSGFVPRGARAGGTPFRSVGGGVTVKQRGGLTFSHGQPFPKQFGSEKGGVFTKTPGAKGTPAPDTTVQPFLTPDQQLGKIQADQAYAEAIAGINAQLAAAPITEKAAEATNIHDSAVNKAQQGALNAARGIFSSSVTNNDFSDIATKLAVANNALAANLSTLQGTLQGALDRNTANQRLTDSAYDTMAVANAQGVTPAVPPPAPAAEKPAVDTSSLAPGIKPLDTGQPGQPKRTPSVRNTSAGPRPISITAQPRSSHATKPGTMNPAIKFPTGMGAF